MCCLFLFFFNLCFSLFEWGERWFQSMLNQVHDIFVISLISGGYRSSPRCCWSCGSNFCCFGYTTCKQLLFFVGIFCVCIMQVVGAFLHMLLLLRLIKARSSMLNLIQWFMWCSHYLSQGIAPLTLNLTKPDPVFGDGFMPLTSSEEMPIRVAMSNSFGFGGTNASLLFASAGSDW